MASVVRCQNAPHNSRILAVTQYKCGWVTIINWQYSTLEQDYQDANNILPTSDYQADPLKSSHYAPYCPQ